MELKPGYKLTEVGVIPEEWEVRKLRDLASTVASGRSKAQDGYAVYAVHGSTGVIGYSEVADYEGDAILVARVGANAGKLNIVSGQYGVTDNTIILRLRIDSCLPFFFRQLESKRLNTLVFGSGQPLITGTQLKNLRIAIPPLPEQRAIAGVLGYMDALLGALGQLIAKKRDLKQAAMQQLLTGNKRLPGFQAKPGFKQTELGVVPEDWEVSPMSAAISDFRGGAPFKPSDFTKSGVKVLPKGGVGRRGYLDVADEDLQFCTQEYADSHPRNQVDGAYTIVVLRDLVPSGPSIGLMVQIKGSESYVLAQGVYGIKVNESRAVPGYLVQLSNTVWYRRVVNSIMVGSTQVHITNTAFKKAQIPLPPLPEQRAIATVLSDMDAGIAALEQRRDKTRALKQGMMQELLTGRIRLV